MLQQKKKASKKAYLRKTPRLSVSQQVGCFTWSVPFLLCTHTRAEPRERSVMSIHWMCFVSASWSCPENQQRLCDWNRDFNTTTYVTRAVDTIQGPWDSGWPYSFTYAEVVQCELNNKPEWITFHYCSDQDHNNKTKIAEWQSVYVSRLHLAAFYMVFFLKYH